MRVENGRVILLPLSSCRSSGKRLVFVDSKAGSVLSKPDPLSQLRWQLPFDTKGSLWYGAAPGRAAAIATLTR